MANNGLEEKIKRLEEKIESLEKKNESLEKMNQRALDYQEIQNVLARHCYNQTTGRNHGWEMETLWAKKNPTWTTNMGVWEGENLWKRYVTINEKGRQLALDRLCKEHPEIENKPENWNIGSYIFHQLTTPCIEVAGDGKTARGVWYSSGSTASTGPDGKIVAGIMWAKFGCDFLKEDGKWKIWHFHRYYDLTTHWADVTPPLPYIDPCTGLGNPYPPNPEVPLPDRPSPSVHYEYFGPYRVPLKEPKPPEPYETFDEADSF